MKELSILVVDDSALYRVLIADAINGISRCNVCCMAADGQNAIDKIRECRPDIVTLDIEMPVMDGLQTLTCIQQNFPNVITIMISTKTKSRAQVTINALELGAFDFVTKPEGNDREQNAQCIQQQLLRIIPSIQAHLEFAEPSQEDRIPYPKKKGMYRQDSEKIKSPSIQVQPDVVAIGLSTGGPKALAEFIPSLPGDLCVPVLIVQHMPALFTNSLAQSLDKKSSISVVEASHDQLVEPGHVYLAPGGKQMKVETRGGNQVIIKITNDPAEHFCKPSVDYLFRSIAQVYKERALGVIMTGMGSDGTLGLRLMKRYGVRTLGQSADTCVVYGMPREAKNAGIIDEEIPLNKLAQAIVANVQYPIAQSFTSK